METKKCPKCLQDRLLTEYQKNKASKDGLQFHCKSCRKTIDSRDKKRLYDKERYHNNRDDYLDQYYFRTYGINLSDYNKLLQEQNNSCAICGCLCSSGKRLAVDHDHATGKVRGLLCGNCNLALGKFQDSISLLNTAIGYLTKHGSKSD